jgi:hypothetical protein
MNVNAVNVVNVVIFVNLDLSKVSSQFSIELKKVTLLFIIH